ncbi:zinc transport system ATP-binding protein [Tistlia consotensis]|uniref:Zinc transport system ATP-binding protein n=1 Tax=Tistlia consotensis USBA 355 TaxID=560819 RepID=A0A1Y6CG64_9PROT|nr:metal ABC transporter ATP-binding protein [Tistlia consotensis]SMF53451.1 zinc transport system ATP-binding protein [Tistlia consotensis USBA 355]SNR85540.1 zinc transport system ATP-binding protein [Tistlia consotensis]
MTEGGVTEGGVTGGGVTGILARAEGIAVSFAGRRVLQDVDFLLRRGEIVSLIGPNGAGKSTLVKVLLGLLRPERGRVERAPGLKVGYVPQRLSVDPTLPLTVAGFLSLPDRRPEAQRRQALAEVGVPQLWGAQVHELSGGELQRVMLARAILRGSDLLVLDEPASSVDVAGQAELFELIARVRDRRHCGILLVSHDLHVVMAGADRVVCLNRHVCCTGSPEAVGLDPAFAELFGSSARVLGLYHHHHDHRHDLAGEAEGQATGTEG